MDRPLIERDFSQRRFARISAFLPAVCLALLSGCYAPLFSHGIPARELPDYFRMPLRTSGAPLNYARLTQKPPADYLLGVGDILEVTVADLFKIGEVHPLRVAVMSSGVIQLPKVDKAVKVDHMNVMGAQAAIVNAYREKGILIKPSVNVTLLEKAAVSVLVLGAVVTPGVYPLPKYENDVGHALAAAGGFNDDAADKIEVHRRIKTPAEDIPRPPMASVAPILFSPQQPAEPYSMAALARTFADAGPSVHYHHPRSNDGMIHPVSTHGMQRNGPNFISDAVPSDIDESMQMFTIPLRGFEGQLSQNDITLQHGDVVVVPNRRHQVFFVVGKLATNNTVRFTVRERERELGGGFILPKDREIDVVTAVAMAGYIDPIDSPTTVTVHRVMPDGRPMLIHVDLIKARYDRRETIFVQAGDIIYLNPDAHWWFRRTFDKVVDDLILLPYGAAVIKRWIR